MIGDEVLAAVRERFPDAPSSFAITGSGTPGGPVRQVYVVLGPREVSILPRMRELPEAEWRERRSVYEYVDGNGYDVLVPGRDFEDRPDTLDALLELLAEVAP